MFNGRRKFWDQAFFWYIDLDNGFPVDDVNTVRTAARFADIALAERRKRWNLLRRILNIFGPYVDKTEDT